MASSVPSAESANGPGVPGGGRGNPCNTQVTVTFKVTEPYCFQPAAVYGSLAWKLVKWNSAEALSS